MTEFRPGQKWISNAEPELGIGRILKVEHRLVTVQFNLVDDTRVYARDQAPLSRVRFRVGDQIRTVDDIELEVEEVSEREGILVYTGDYRGTRTSIFEVDLDPNVTFSNPVERLFTQQLDENRRFNLRYYTLKHRAEYAGSPVRGLLGPRVALIPHQFYIAAEVASRHAPRVLLADEVGLGKTIEAGLIMHQQLTTGRASRILVIVPPALTFQWFVEMVRRFNLQFTIMDEERCQMIESDNRPEFEEDADDFDNPFDAQQLVLCSIDLFTNHPQRLDQAAQAGWDLVVVDEAHHLQWHHGSPGPDYEAVEVLSQSSPGLLLLTATPEQLGQLGHFSRLRLLDPSRYHDFEAFRREEADYADIAGLLPTPDPDGKGPDGKTNLDPQTANTLRQRLGEFAPADDADLVPALLDRHGTGRVLFRNVRESVAGFPSRLLETSELGELPADIHVWHSKDPRIAWLSSLIESQVEKFLVICTRADTAIALEKYLRDRTTLRTVAFHEGMDLIARDRAANYFADSERGAQVLVCSEIGSEGRNFQFAHHLVMYDLPESPDLLEQRIGRLDRIGQHHDVTIHVPFSSGSRQSALLRIYDEGLGIFQQPNPAAQAIYDEIVTPHLQTKAAGPEDARTIDEIVDRVRSLSEARLADMRSGRDRLVELNSHRPDVSAALLAAVESSEGHSALEDYMEMSFDAFGLESDPLSDELFSVKPTDSMQRHVSVSVETSDRTRYPELPDEGLTYTFDRQTALAREDALFLTWENPMVEQAVDLVTSDVTGNCTVIVIKLKGVPTGTLLVETLHRIECIAPARLGADRFLPPEIVRSLITPERKDISDRVPFNTWDDQLEVNMDAINQIIAQQETGIRKLLSAADEAAEEKFAPIRETALTKMNRQLQGEIDRLASLAGINPNVRPEEIDFLRESHAALQDAIGTSRVSLEAVRVIIVA